MSFFCSIEERILGWFFLTLSHRNVSELFVTSRNIILSCNTLHLRCRIDSWEEYEEYWNTVISLGESLEDAKWRLLDVFFTHHLADE